MATQTRAKRSREEPAVAEDFMMKAKIIMHADPFKERAPKGTDKAFCALFGCSCMVAHQLWKIILEHAMLAQGGTMTHPLWTLMFLKVCPTEENMKHLTGGADQKTTHKWIDVFLERIADLAPHLVSDCCCCISPLDQ